MANGREYPAQTAAIRAKLVNGYVSVAYRGTLAPSIEKKGWLAGASSQISNLRNIRGP